MLLVVLITVGFGIVAPIGLLMLPLAGMLLAGSGRSGDGYTIGVLAGAFGLWWLLDVGTPPEQVVRAAAVTGAVSFVILSMGGRATVTHRALAAVVIAAASVVLMTGAVGMSWAEVLWWQENRGAFTQAVLTQFWLATRPAAEAGTQVDGVIALMPRVMVDYFPAILALQLIAGIAAATFAAQRIGLRIPGRPMGRFIDFRFSEHLGWVLVAGLAVLLLADDRRITVPVGNAVVVTGVLYAWRGAAVSWFSIRNRPGPKWLITAVVIVSVLLVWPVVFATLIIGVVDAGLDFRRRWQLAR